MLNPITILANTSGGIQQVAPATGTVTSFAYSTVSAVTLLSGNLNRAAFSIFNDTNSVYLVKMGTGATGNSWSFYIPSQAMYDSVMPAYTGPVTGLGYGAGSGTIYVTELTP